MRAPSLGQARVCTGDENRTLPVVVVRGETKAYWGVKLLQSELVHLRNVVKDLKYWLVLLLNTFLLAFCTEQET